MFVTTSLKAEYLFENYISNLTIIFNLRILNNKYFVFSVEWHETKQNDKRFHEKINFIIRNRINRTIK